MSNYRIIKGSIWDSPWFETRYDPPELLVDCPEHEKDPYDEVFPNCPNCHRVTIEENLRRAQGAALNILQWEKSGLTPPERWHKAANDIGLWEKLLDQMPPESAGTADPGESDPAALPSIIGLESVQPN